MTDQASRIKVFRRLASDLGLETSSSLARARLRWEWSRIKQDGAIWLLAGAIFADGLLSIPSVLAVRFLGKPRLFSVLLPLKLYEWSRSLTVAFGFVLMYVSFHLLRRRRVAWWLAIAAATLSTLTSIGRGQLWVTALVPGASVVLLLLLRRRFTGKSEPRSIVQGIGLMIVSLLVALAYGVVGFWWLGPQYFGFDFHLVDALFRIVREFTLLGNSDLVAKTRHARWFLTSLRTLGLVSGLFAVYSLFRPVIYRLQTLPQQRVQVRSLLEEYGGTSTALDFFRLWPDKSYFFSEKERCCVTYKVAWGIAIALGDPVGAKNELDDTVGAFLQYCSDNGWEAAFHQALPDLIPLYRRHGFQAIKIGENAVVDLENFAERTARSRRLREPCRKLAKAGYAFAGYTPPHDAWLLDQIEEISQEWLSLPGRRERTFTLGRFDRDYMNETPLFVVQEPTKRIIAFVNQIPSYRSGETTIDLMRHRREAPNGTMDFLFVELLLHLRDEGYRAFSLGLAPLAGVGEDPGASLQEQAAHHLAEQLKRFFSFKGLRDYKAKFEPAWEDRYIVYQGGPLGLLQTAFALTRATEG